MDEIKTLELLWASEIHLPQYPGLTRGLLAVLLYWDGRYALVSALKNILCHSSHVQANVLQVLYDEQIIASLVDSYFSLSVEGELDKLAIQRGLGDARHRREIRELVTMTKLAIAEAIFLLSQLDNFRYIILLDIDFM